jgi:hypothetical protein
MHPRVIAGFRVAAAITCQWAGSRAAHPACGGDRDGAGLVVAGLDRKSSVHRVLRAN